MAASSVTSGYTNRIIFIRHAEKGFTEGDKLQKRSSSWFWPPWGPPGRRPGGGRGFPNGLSEVGKERAQYIRTYFGNESEFDFGLIFAAPREGLVKETERTYATVAPLASDLGLTIDISCADSEPSCVVARVEEFVKTSDQDILICWKHFDLNLIATALGAPNAKRTYPGERNDVLWIMEIGAITEKRSMHCPVPDDKRIDEDDPDYRSKKYSQGGSLPGCLQPV